MNPITKIFCAFPIFAPTKSLFDRNKDSVLSFISYLKKTPSYLDGSKGIKLDISYAGWCKEQIWFDDLKSTIKENIPGAKVYQFDKNYGKAKVVNSLTFDYAKEFPDTQLLFTCDSDMLFEESQGVFFDRLVLAAQMMEQKSPEFFGSKKNFGMVALNQSGECCHWWPDKKPDGYTGINQIVKYNVNGENGFSLYEELAWPQDGAGIAGGALFLNFKLWKIIGGYRNFNTPYAGDDGLILRDIQQNNGTVCVIKTLSMVHPTPNDESDYRKWKDESVQKSFEDYDKGKFEENMKEFEKVLK